jgi:predicted nuclease of predicted toxin-antitoxin system
LRFLLDNDIDAAVGKMLRRERHECWTASAVGLAAATDDELTVWAAERGAALVSTDAEFGRRRMRNATGQHIWMKCLDWEASEVLAKHLPDVIARLGARPDLTIRVSPENVTDSSDWG